MRRWIALAAGLYPRAFRARYGEEFDALIEDHNPGWREFTDVIRGALKMQMTNTAAYWKLAGGLALAGAAVACAVSFRVPRIYESTAVIRMTPQQIAEPVNNEYGFRESIASQLNDMEQSTLSRTTLAGIITQPGLDLYPEERAQEPLEDVVIRMRTRDIQIRTLDQGPAAFTVSFSYPDRQKAQAVVRELTAQFARENVEVNRDKALVWQAIWPQFAPPPGPNLEVLDPPSAPQKPINASPLGFAEVGLALGLGLGLLAATAIQWPKRTLQMAGFALGFCAVAVAISYLLPETYTSNAVMLLAPPLVTVNPTGDAAREALPGRLQRWEKEIMSDASLQDIVTNCKLDLYDDPRSTEPMRSAAANLRRQVSIRPVAQSAFEISFSYPDRAKAQGVARELVTRFVEQNVTDQQKLAQDSGNAKAIEIAEHKAGEQLEILDPPSDPAEPAFPDRLKVALGGFAAGMVIGAITLLHWHAPAPQPA